MEYEEVLTKGLQEGFAGETNRGKVDRGGFILEVSHYETDNGDIYHDEWIADRIGTGHEIVRVDGKIYTRVYGGGTVSEEKLKSLGLVKKDVIKFLKKQILENREEIRLHNDFLPEADGDWKYEYEVVDREDDIPVLASKESIYYKGDLVFVHDFVLTPVE
ncbi:hypothetical protein ACFL0F_01630 [Patescibacteria group bacterium]